MEEENKTPEEEQGPESDEDPRRRFRRLIDDDEEEQNGEGNDESARHRPEKQLGTTQDYFASEPRRNLGRGTAESSPTIWSNPRSPDGPAADSGRSRDSLYRRNRA